MHVEIQVALNFVISYLYNKLPRRRVNLFGEELERALREKFNGHWYPEKPMRGSAYRCIKTGTGSVDPVLDTAARESGIPVQDILENLPQELAVWVDPGEVSYRIGEKGAVRILYNESMAQSALNASAAAAAAAAAAATSCGSSSPDDDLDTEVRKTFNPDAQCFRPIQNALGNLTISCTAPKVCLSPYQNGSGLSTSPPPANPPARQGQQPPPQPPKSTNAPANGVPAPVAAPQESTSPTNAKSSSNSTAPFIGRPPAPPLTFTTATFAQTKFGSTKLKSSSKRANRMSPTEFSNYIKQRALQQQQTQQQPGFVVGSNRPRSLSPNPQQQSQDFFFPAAGRQYLQYPTAQYHPHHQQPHHMQSELHFPQHQKQFPPRSFMDGHLPTTLPAGATNSSSSNMLLTSISPNSSLVPPGATSPAGNNNPSSGQDSGKQQLLDGLGFGLPTYQPGQYQHLLVAN
ncbi:protein Tob1 [Neocloeon triangulifer]|uniref:protein Tob1 n=1 Tax=Neocloeon triangulifer TaxID=2078957 RepID=UPI00286F0429|nr:protein Tob1 [Neocloeon triangulifer]XP_059480462.1 protein Tob1 [Neocloeon triangulifer]